MCLRDELVFEKSQAWSFIAEVIATGEVVPADDLDALSHDGFETAFSRLSAVERTVAAQKLACLESARRRGSHARHGFRDTAAWVASLTGDRVGAARRDVVVAEQVAATPVVAEALSSGAVSKTQADVLVGGAALPTDVRERLVERAEVLSVRQLGQAVREAQFDHGLAPPGLPTDVPIGERRAAALVALARHLLERTESSVTKRTGLAHILGLVPYETLIARAGGSATLASGAVISGEVARMLACDAGISGSSPRARARSSTWGARPGPCRSGSPKR